MHRWRRILFAASGLIPLLGLLSKPPDVTLLIYTAFVGAWFARGFLSRGTSSLPGSLPVQLIGAFLVAGTLTEGLAWLNNYLKAAAEPALFHPQLVADLIIGFGFYGGWAAAWLVAMRWFRFSPWEPFVITGLQGIFFEQLGAVFLAMVRAWASNPAQSILFGLYVFAVHGSAAGLGMLPVFPRINRPENPRHWLRLPVVIILMVSFAFVGCWLVALSAQLFGGLPAKRSITEHPFW